MSLDITIYEGGERLYVYPFSYYIDYANRVDNKVFYLNPDQYYPYKNDHLIDAYNSMWSQIMQIRGIKRLWYVHIKKALVSVCRSIRSCDMGLFWWYYRASAAFIATDYPDIRISIGGQLSVRDDFRMTNSYYLVPSTQYIDKRISGWMKSTNPLIQDDIALFRSWEIEQKNLGRKINYLCSIDT
jgi:hypothetical protein